MTEQKELSPDYDFAQRSIGMTIYSHIPGLNFLFWVFAFIHGFFQVRNFSLFNRILPPAFESIWITIRYTTIRVIYSAILNLILIALIGVNPFGWMIDKYLILFQIKQPIIESGLPYLYLGTGSWMEYLVTMIVIAGTFYIFAVLGAIYGIFHYRSQLKSRFEEIKVSEEEQGIFTTNQTM